MTKHSPALFNDQGLTNELLQDWIASFKPTTQRAYGRDIEAFARFMEVGDPLEAMRLLVSNGHGYANGMAMKWRNQMIAEGLAPATINRRLSALRGIVDMGNQMGKIAWGLQVRGVKSSSYKDTRGPGMEKVLTMWETLKEGEGAKAARDRCIFRLLWDLALRRGEISALDYEDVDLDGGYLWVKGKGRAEKEQLSLPRQTAASIREWIGHRGTGRGPLLLAMDRACAGKRLGTDGLYKMIRSLARDCGIESAVSPHRIRHSAITYRLEISQGDLRNVARFSRHAKIETMMIYDDKRKDHAGQIATQGAEALV